MVVLAYNPSTQEVKADENFKVGYPLHHSEFETNLNNVKPCFEKTKQKQVESVPMDTQRPEEAVESSRAGYRCFGDTQFVT